MRSRFMMELTTPEAEDYLKGEDRIAILPVGSTEMHGPHQPIGTDTIVTKAFALRLAEEADGIVLPELNYSWTGSTDGFKGTISIDIDLEQKIVESIIVNTYRMGFRRIIVMSIHAPNIDILYLSVRRIFEKYHIPVLYIDPYRTPFTEDAAKIFEGEYRKSKEASLVLAALKILGKQDLYTEEEMKYDDEAPGFPELVGRLQKLGGIGYFMQDVRHHACPSRFVSLKRGLEYINAQVNYILSVLKDLDTYAEIIKAQKNKGYSEPLD